MNEEEEVYNGPQSFKQQPLSGPENMYLHQSQYNQPQYNQNQYNQPEYSQPQYNQPQYNQPQYNQPQYIQPNMYSNQNPNTMPNMYSNQPVYSEGPDESIYNDEPNQPQYIRPSQPKPQPQVPYGQRPVVDKPKKSKKGKLIVILSVTLFILAGVAACFFFVFSNKEKSGAGSLETIGYSYVDAFNRSDASILKSYISNDVKDYDAFTKQFNDYTTNHKLHIKELDKSQATVTVGEAYSESDRKALLSKYEYKDNKSDEIRDAVLSVKYTDINDITNAGTYSCVITCMKVKSKWFIVEIRDIDIQQYSSNVQNVDPDGLSDDLFSQQIYLNGNLLTMPFDYSELNNEYSFNLSDYGYEDDYELAPGDKIPGTIALYSNNMDEDVDFWIGLINDSDEKKKVADCKVNSIVIDTSYSETNNYPELILPGGITWGSTYDEIKEVYGEPSYDPFKSNALGYTKYDYINEDYSYSVSLYVYDDKGLAQIDITCL